MSNITQIAAVGVGYEYSTYILGTMFLVSEILPLLKKKPNGLLHAVLCLIQGSKCLLDNVLYLVYICIKNQYLSMLLIITECLNV